MSARALAASALVLVAAGCGGVERPAAHAPTPQQREISELALRMERLHPNLFSAVSRARFRAEAAALARRAPDLSRDQLVVGLMRLTALPGPRNGHTGIYPHDPSHPKPLHFYPLRVYDFSDGLVVTGAADPAHVGKRIVAIGDQPIASVLERLRPLVPRDNESTRRWLLPEFVVSAEVLRGLGIVGSGPATFAFADGSRAELEAIPGPTYVTTLGSALEHPLPERPPVWLQRLDEAHLVRTLDNGRAVYVAYRTTTYPDPALIGRMLRLGRQPRVRRVIVDVRLNHGGDNTTYAPLLDALRAVGRKGVLLQGRATFSAAGNFAAEVDRKTRARLVGEPSGGAPNQWGDSSPLALPRAGLTAYVAVEYVEVDPRAGSRATVPPTVRVEPSSADHFAGRDPVLARALR